MNSRRKLIFLALLAVAAAAAGASSAHWLASRDQPEEITQATVFSSARELPGFSLTDQDGAVFDKYRLAGRWSLLFFGFTHCPDICPTTLATLAAAQRELADLPPAERPRVVFVSVDPQRDTPAAIGEYMQAFGADALGITGAAAQIESLAGALGAAYRVSPGTADAYSVDHTAAVFVIDPQARLAAVTTPPHVSAGIASDMRILARRGRDR